MHAPEITYAIGKAPPIEITFSLYHMFSKKQGILLMLADCNHMLVLDNMEEAVKAWAKRI